METILHILGLCPDSMSHFNILTFLSYYYNQLQQMFINILNYFK